MQCVVKSTNAVFENFLKFAQHKKYTKGDYENTTLSITVVRLASLLMIIWKC